MLGALVPLARYKASVFLGYKVMNTKRLGVTNVNLWSPNKRDALFFDQIATGSLEKELSEVADPAVRADWEFLASNDYVVEYKYDMAGRKGGLILGGQRAAEVD